MKQKINVRLIGIAVLAVLATLICMTCVYYSLFQKQVKKDLKIQAQVLGETGAFDDVSTPAKSFDIAKDEAESALSVYLDSDDDQIRIAREEFDTVFSGDKSAVTKEFASDYSIVINDKVYCPNWIYTHSVSDYYEAGISAEDIDSKVTLYSVFGFTDEAREAFEDKLSVYLNKRVGITPKVQQNTYDTDYLQYDIYEDELEDVFDDSLVIDDVVEIIDD